MTRLYLLTVTTLAVIAAGVFIAQDHGRDRAPQSASVFASEVPECRDGQMLVQTHLYTSCIDTEAHQPAWVAYVVRRSDWDGRNVLDRNFHTPHGLRSVLLESSDFTGSGFDLGHCYGLQFVSASPYAYEVNSMSAVIAQRATVNRGVMLAVENRILRYSETEPVYVLNGQLWEAEMPERLLPRADEEYRIGSHLFVLLQSASVREGYLIPQDTTERNPDLFRMEYEELRERISKQWVPSIVIE